jgi:hypothetical protein
MRRLVDHDHILGGKTRHGECLARHVFAATKDGVSVTFFVGQYLKAPLVAYKTSNLCF